jgi:L,D-transpeptidase YcbB
MYRVGGCLLSCLLACIWSAGLWNTKALGTEREIYGFSLPEPLSRITDIKPLSRAVRPERRHVTEETGEEKPASAANTHSANPSADSAIAGRDLNPPHLPELKKLPEPSPPQKVEIFQPSPLPSLSEDTLSLTAQAAELYMRIGEGGGWAAIPAGSNLGSRGQQVVLLKKRLAVTSDLSPDDLGGDRFDPALREAVRRFQYRHGLPMSGVVDGRTLKALNIPASVRARQLMASAERLASQNIVLAPVAVVVNIPSAQVEAIEGGKIIRRYTAVVGRPDRPSPLVVTRITAVNINPTWTVPTSIARKDILPKIQRDPSYLSRSNMRLLDNNGYMIDPRDVNWQTLQAEELTFRQDSGKSNALGQIRIDMPNPHAVYLHDTPSKKLFQQTDRFHSSGCIRVENVNDLAVWLLKETPASQGLWTRAMVQKAIGTQTRKDIRLSTPVPVAFIYMTGYATRDGLIHFRDDIYQWDTPSRTASPREQRRAGLRE